MFVLQLQLGTSVIGGAAPPPVALMGTGVAVAFSLLGASTANPRVQGLVALGSLVLIVVAAASLLFRPLAAG